MDYSGVALNELLKDRRISELFDDEFHKATWLDASALIGSESTISDLYSDGTVPKAVLDKITERLNALD